MRHYWLERPRTRVHGSDNWIQQKTAEVAGPWSGTPLRRYQSRAMERLVVGEDLGLEHPATRSPTIEATRNRDAWT